MLYIRAKSLLGNRRLRRIVLLAFIITIIPTAQHQVVCAQTRILIQPDGETSGENLASIYGASPCIWSNTLNHCIDPLVSRRNQNLCSQDPETDFIRKKFNWCPVTPTFSKNSSSARTSKSFFVRAILVLQPTVCAGIGTGHIWRRRPASSS